MLRNVATLERSTGLLRTSEIVGTCEETAEPARSDQLSFATKPKVCLSGYAFKEFYVFCNTVRDKHGFNVELYGSDAGGIVNKIADILVRIPCMEFNAHVPRDGEVMDVQCVTKDTCDWFSFTYDISEGLKYTTDGVKKYLLGDRSAKTAFGSKSMYK